MPELPEVETTIRGLKPIIGSSIINVKINTPKLRFLIPKNLSLIKRDVVILNIKRMGKFIIMHLNNNHSIVIHLGMSGRLRLYNALNFIKKKHDHFIISTNKEHLIVFNDSRRFGFVDYDKTYLVYKRKNILNLGVDALEKSLTGELLFMKISKRVVTIKQILLNQSIIAGIGNIYASEILFNAKISPFYKGKDLTLLQCVKIVNSTKKILNKAIFFGGSTLRDYVSTDGTLGGFQNEFKVYNQEGKTIGGKYIRKIVHHGRATYYCPDLQKIKYKTDIKD